MKYVKRRGGKTDPKSTDGDVESQTPGSPAQETPRTVPAGSRFSSSPAGGGAGGGNPATAFLRKILMLTARDVAENPQGSYLLTIIKDVISGTILGVFFLMILIFLDYRNIVQLGSARAFRRAAFELMTDPETVKSIEDNIDVKFIPLDVFKSMSEEITRNQEKIKDNAGLKQHEDDYIKKKGELETLKKEYDEMKARGDAILGLDKWCGGCKGGWGQCDARIKYLSDTYHTPEIKAKVDIMNTGKCIQG
mmetsp:Transcript_26578/g.45364  ORF Transcript_26578/g.45364 Transcript_26578/m.45364 type:complete len:250 (-) Transcript_26578:166-915(-)